MYKYFKRFADVIVSALSLLILFPILFPIIVGLLFTGEGYVWFFQERVGYKNKKFTIWKFATMLKDSAKMPGGYLTTINDPRITPMGGFLRKSKINELPQLINIFKGDMSFIGPRPVMEISFMSYPKEIREFIYSVKPGLTGLGSLIFRNEEALITKVKSLGMDPVEFYKNEIYPFKGELEKYYQEKRGFFTDLKIFIGTILVVLFPNDRIPYFLFPNAPFKTFILGDNNSN